MTLEKYLLKLLHELENAVIIGSLGNISKTLIEIGSEKNTIIPVKGAMGCAMGVGLGYALNTDKQVYVLIGDGAFLMKMDLKSLALILRILFLKILRLPPN